MIRTDERKQDPPEDMILIAEGLFFMGSTKQDITNLLELDHNIEAERLENEIPSTRFI